MSSFCWRSTAPRNSTTPAGNLSLMRRQAGQSAFWPLLGLAPPLPASLVIDCAALSADGVVLQLLLLLIRIQDVIFLGMSSDPANGSKPARAQVRLLHLKSHSEVDAGRTRRVLSDVLACPEVWRREPGHRRMGSVQLVPELTNAVVRRLVNEHMSLLIKAK